MAAIAAMAFAASTAAAQGPGGVTVEVRNEPAGTHLASNARLHAEGEVALFGHAFGIEVQASDCHLEFEGRVNEDGEGAVETAAFRDHAGQNDCTRVPCPATQWPVHVDRVNGQLRLWAEFCIVPESGGSTNRCEVVGNVIVGPGGSHDYEVTYNDTPGVVHAGVPCEVTGSVHLEYDAAHPAIQLL